MSGTRQEAIVIAHKFGVPIYATNPSIPDPEDIKRNKTVRFGNDKRGFVVDNGTGEVLGVGGVGFYEFEEVDNTRFVKMFLAGVKQTAGLSKAGLSVFELVYREVQATPNTDRVTISFYDASKKIEGLSERSYQRGLRELLEKKFLFRSPAESVFFVNIQYMFNGDRLAFVKGYKRKGAAQQGQLPLIPEDSPPALPAPKD
jgi:hypothetical protein